MWHNGFAEDYFFDDDVEPPPHSENLIRVLNSCLKPVSNNVLLNQNGSITQYRIDGPMYSVGKQMALKYNKRYDYI